jgi:hypothetical protein
MDGWMDGGMDGWIDRSIDHDTFDFFCLKIYVANTLSVSEKVMLCDLKFVPEKK